MFPLLFFPLLERIITQFCAHSNVLKCFDQFDEIRIKAKAPPNLSQPVNILHFTFIALVFLSHCAAVSFLGESKQIDSNLPDRSVGVCM